jgi:hypothetical protein
MINFKRTKPAEEGAAYEEGHETDSATPLLNRHDGLDTESFTYVDHGMNEFGDAMNAFLSLTPKVSPQYSTQDGPASKTKAGISFAWIAYATTAKRISA